MSAVATRILSPGHYVSTPLNLSWLVEAHRTGVAIRICLIRYEPGSQSPPWYFSYYGGDGHKTVCLVDVIVPDTVDFTAVIRVEDYPEEIFESHEELEEIEEQEDDPSSAGKFFFHLIVPAAA